MCILFTILHRTRTELSATWRSACHVFTSVWSLLDNEDWPKFALRKKAVWQKLGSTGIFLKQTKSPPTHHYNTGTEACGFETTEAFNGLFWTSDKLILCHVEKQSSDWSGSGNCGLWQSEESVFMAEKQQTPSMWSLEGTCENSEAITCLMLYEDWEMAGDSGLKVLNMCVLNV